MPGQGCKRSKLRCPCLLYTSQISRQTVRNAFQELETDGLISRSKGSGSFVAKEVEVFQKEKIIGILFTNVGNYISSKILTGFETVFYPKGYSLLLEQSHNRLENESLFLKKMLNSKVSGLIIESVKSSLPSPYTDLYEQLRLHHIPFVFINNRLCNVDAVSYTHLIRRYRPHTAPNTRLR